uniref:Microfibril associated protein 2 n=1 Tax=Gallus gallus TaxID=9031 RepID=A0A8V0Z788_CHICK
MGPPLGPPRSACWPKCAYPTSVCANPNRLALPKPIGVGSQRLHYLQNWMGVDPQFPLSISGLGSPSHATKLPPGWTDGCIPNRCIVLVILLPTFTVFSLCPHPDCAVLLQLPPITMRALCLVLLGLPALLVQGQYSRFEGITYPEPVQYSQYDQQAEIQDYYDYHDVTPRTPEEQFRFQSQQQSQQEVVPAPTMAAVPETEPTEPGPLDCREEQYPCTRLYSVHKPCKQCLNEICFYSLRRVYVINKEICVRTVCAHEELLRADLCRDKFSKCGVMATSGLCQTVVTSCARSCGGC